MKDNPYRTPYSHSVFQEMRIMNGCLLKMIDACGLLLNTCIRRVTIFVHVNNRRKENDMRGVRAMSDRRQRTDDAILYQGHWNS